jgi:hypothetical protein
MMTGAWETDQSETDNLLTSGASVSNIRADFLRSIEANRIAVPCMALSGDNYSESHTLQRRILRANFAGGVGQYHVFQGSFLRGSIPKASGPQARACALAP